MRKFEVKLEILNKVAENKWEFMWEGKVRKADYNYTTLFVEVMDEMSAIELVSDQCQGSMKIMHVHEVSDDDAKTTNIYLELATNVYSPKLIIENIIYQGLGISNN